MKIATSTMLILGLCALVALCTSPAVLAQQSAPAVSPIIGVWISDGFINPRGITITSVGLNGDLTGCYWGWNQFENWGRRLYGNVQGDTESVNTAKRFTEIFGRTATATFNGSVLTIINLKTSGIYSLAHQNDELSGAYTNTNHPNWNRTWAFRKSWQNGTVCP